MRIGTLQLFRQGVSSILDQQSRLAITQNQLAVGKRIVNPADDPTGSAQLIGLSETAKTTHQFQRNILATSLVVVYPAGMRLRTTSMKY